MRLLDEGALGFGGRFVAPSSVVGEFIGNYKIGAVGVTSNYVLQSTDDLRMGCRCEV